MASGLPRSVTFRLALGYGLLVVAMMALISALFYFGTIGVLSRGIDDKIATISDQLERRFQDQGRDGLKSEIERLLNDGIDSDTEVYLLVDEAGRKIAGNLATWPDALAVTGHLSDQKVIRAGRPSISRLLTRRLADGSVLFVGRDIGDIEALSELVWRALLAGGVFALQLAVAGAYLFRRQVERRIAAIRLTARRIQAGEMDWRIPIETGDDEFSRLSRDINMMLDRIGELMDGVRHVSNAIAHDLRTPLSRIRGQIDRAFDPGMTPARMSEQATKATAAIDDLILLLDRLLLIAEGESGSRRRSFEPVDLAAMLTDLAELYDALAEERGSLFTLRLEGRPGLLGDKELLAGALANLLDNAVKYAGPKAGIVLSARTEGKFAIAEVADDGPGIPASERGKVIERFYRMDESRSQPGHGLGLSLVAAIARLHGGTLVLDDAHPGLVARLVLPGLDSYQSVS